MPDKRYGRNIVVENDEEMLIAIEELFDDEKDKIATVTMRRDLRLRPSERFEYMT